MITKFDFLNLVMLAVAFVLSVFISFETDAWFMGLYGLLSVVIYSMYLGEKKDRDEQ